MSMLKHVLLSNARWQSSVGRIRTNERTNLRRAWLSRIDHLTFRNARAHIRISTLGMVGTSATRPVRGKADEERLRLVMERMDAEAAS